MAQAQPPHSTTHSAGGLLAIERVQPNEPGALIVTLPDLPVDGSIPIENSAYGDNVSPALSWTRMLEAETYAVILEDPDAPQEQPFLHWMIWNIPGDADGLPAGAGGKLPPDLAKGVQGRNAAGKYGYFGPRPPEGHGMHRYHFQVFALDNTLPNDPDLSFGELINMLKANTLRHGEVVGTYERRERPEAPAGRDTGAFR